MELELLNDEQINRIEDNWLKTSWNNDNEFPRMIAKAQAELTARQFLNKLRAIDKESGDNIEFDRNMALLRNELNKQFFAIDTGNPTCNTGGAKNWHDDKPVNKEQVIEL